MIYFQVLSYWWSPHQHVSWFGCWLGGSPSLWVCCWEMPILHEFILLTLHSPVGVVTNPWWQYKFSRTNSPRHCKQVCFLLLILHCQAFLAVQPSWKRIITASLLIDSESHCWGPNALMLQTSRGSQRWYNNLTLLKSDGAWCGHWQVEISTVG